jgi:hypothetical protein
MMTEIRFRKVLPRVVALFATAWFLISSSPPPDEPICDHESISVAFRSTGTCGPEGIIVVHVSRWNGEVWIDNSEQIGLAPKGPIDEGGYYAPELGEGHGEYFGADCPFQLKNGNWEVYGRSRDMGIWSTPDAGVTRDAAPRDAALADAASADAAPMVFDAGVSMDFEPTDRYQRWDTQDVCGAILVSGKLELNCSYRGQSTCRSTLTPLQ